MKFHEEKVNAEKAGAYLEKNKRNRRIRWPWVHELAEIMLAGQWKQNTGQTVKIAVNGEIVDGQHRMLAIIEANKKQPGIAIGVHFATGLELAVHDAIDTGKARNACDVFTREGIKNANKIPSMITAYLAFKAGARAVDNFSKPSNQQILDFYRCDEMFWQAVSAMTTAWYLAFAKILSPSTIGGLYCIFYDINQQAAYDFMDQLCTGFNIKNDSMKLLRTKLMQDRHAMRKMPKKLRNALIIKTWNLYRKNIVAKILKWDEMKENFPVAI